MTRQSAVKKASLSIKHKHIRLGKAEQSEQELSSPVCYAKSPELRPEFLDLEPSSTAPKLKDKALENDD